MAKRPNPNRQMRRKLARQGVTVGTVNVYPPDPKAPKPVPR